MTAPARVLCADPAWEFRDKLPGKKRGAARNYETMSVAEIKKYPLPPIARDAFLFLWRVSSMPQEALDVVRAWGFVPKSEIVWVKQTVSRKLAFGMGHYVRNAHETAIIAVRGRARVARRNQRSVFFAPVGPHSAKPEVFYDLVEEMCGRGPYAELFARRQREGWTCYGNEPEARAAARRLTLFGD